MKEKLSLKAFKKKKFAAVDGKHFVKGGRFEGNIRGCARRCPPPIEEKATSSSGKV